MPLFSYEAVTDAGERADGRQRASSEAALARDLAARGLHALDVAVADDDVGRGGRARRRDVLEATRAVSSLLAAGLPLARALALAEGMIPARAAAVLAAVRAEVERGESFAGALAAHPRAFPSMYVGLVRAGERSGDLPGAFVRLTAQLEREAQLRGRVASALFYPVLLALAGSVAIGVLLLVVLPRFATLLTDAGATPPASTRIVLGAATLLGNAWPLLVALAAALAGTGLWMQATPAGRLAGARLLLAVPGVRTLRRDVLGARVARLLGALLGGGAPLFAALGDVRDSLADPVARDAVGVIRGRVRDGAPLAAALAGATCFPPVLARLVAVGEAGGALVPFLGKAAELLDERTERTAQRLTTLVEPALIVVLGLVVAAIAFALLQAIYGLDTGAFVA